MTLPCAPPSQFRCQFSMALDSAARFAADTSVCRPDGSPPGHFFGDKLRKLYCEGVSRLRYADFYSPEKRLTAAALTLLLIPLPSVFNSWRAQR